MRTGPRCSGASGGSRIPPISKVPAPALLSSKRAKAPERVSYALISQAALQRTGSWSASLARSVVLSGRPTVTVGRGGSAAGLTPSSAGGGRPPPSTRPGRGAPPGREVEPAASLEQARPVVRPGDRRPPIGKRDRRVLARVPQRPADRLCVQVTARDRKRRGTEHRQAEVAAGAAGRDQRAPVRGDRRRRVDAVVVGRACERPAERAREQAQDRQ